MKRLILASASPRRKELMSDFHLPFEIVVSKCEEVFSPSLTLSEAIEDVAYQKAYDVYTKHPDAVVIGCDTMVVYQNEKLGKPKDEDDARRMLMMLSNQTHEVISGVCILGNGIDIRFHESTKVTFYSLEESLLNAYLATKTYGDKAGAYAIQDPLSRLFVKKLDGDYYNVVGFPVARLYRELMKILEEKEG